MEAGERVLTLQDPELETVVRILAASVNARLMAALAAKRAEEPAEGWMFLSEIAEAIGERPGSVGLALQKLLPLLEERRHRGKRYFRARYRSIELHLAPF